MTENEQTARRFHEELRELIDRHAANIAAGDTDLNGRLTQEMVKGLAVIWASAMDAAGANPSDDYPVRIVDAVSDAARRVGPHGEGCRCGEHAADAAEMADAEMADTEMAGEMVGPVALGVVPIGDVPPNVMAIIRDAAAEQFAALACHARYAGTGRRAAEGAEEKLKAKVLETAEAFFGPPVGTN